MRNRLAIAATLIAALAPFPSHADPVETPVTAPETATPDPFVAPRRVVQAVTAAAPAVHVPRELDEPIPYLFECELTRWTGDPSNVTTTVERVEGVLEDEPVHFEADSYLIDDETGKRGGGYACTLKVGNGPENPDTPFSRAFVLAAATVSFVSHGHVLWKPVDGRAMGIAGIRGGGAMLRRGHSMTWTWAGSISQSDEKPIEHAADCDGVTIVRGYNPKVGAGCEHENPSPRPKPAPESDDEGLHDGLPPEVPADIPIPQLPDLPVTVPSDLPVDVSAVIPIPTLVDVKTDWSRRGDLNS